MAISEIFHILMFTYHFPSFLSLPPISKTLFPNYPSSNPLLDRSTSFTFYLQYHILSIFRNTKFQNYPIIHIINFFELSYHLNLDHNHPYFSPHSPDTLHNPVLHLPVPVEIFSSSRTGK